MFLKTQTNKNGFTSTNSKISIKLFKWSVLLIGAIIYQQISITNGQHKGDEVCETLPSEIHLIKGNYIYTIKVSKINYFNLILKYFGVFFF